MNTPDDHTDQPLPLAEDERVEWWCPVPCDGGLGEIRVRHNGDVVWTGNVGPVKWAALDGISFPTSEFTPVKIVRNDVIRIDNIDPSLGGTELVGKRFLYHYTAADTAIKYILPSRQLRLSPYDHLNDPRESKEWLFAVVGPEGALRPGQSIEIGRSVSDQIKGRSRVLCLCSDGFHVRRDPPDIELQDTLGWTHPTMWAHYADKHRGVVLVFNRQKLLANSIGALGTKCKLHFGHILYVPLDHAAGAMPLIIDYRVWASRSAEESAIEHLERHRDWLFFTKHPAWAPEQECRIVAFGNVERYEFIPIDGALAEIIVGEGAHTEVAAHCRAFGVPVSQILWRNGVPVRVPAG